MPESHDFLDDRLAALREVAVPPLPAAAAVRARGKQRRARARAAVAGALAVAVVGAAGAVALAAGGPGSDALEPAPFATRQAPAPTAPPSADPSPPPVAVVAPEQLLDAESVSAVRGGTWQTPNPDDDDAPFPFVTACPEGGPPAQDGIVRVLEGPGQQVVMSQVLAYGDDVAAAAAWADLVEEVERCPRREEDVEPGLASTAEHVLVRGLPGNGPTRVYGTVTSRDCDGCAQRVQHFSISQVGPYLALVRLLSGELDELPPLAAAAERRARCATSDCDVEPPPAPRAWEVTAGFLLPEQASAAELPGWREVPGDRGRPILDPCGKGGTPLEDAVLESDTTALGSQREAGGSSLTQQVLRYRSAEKAAEAFEAWSERVRTCARERTSDGELAWSVVEGGRTEDTDQMAVRRVPCQGSTCTDHFATYALVARVGDGLTLVRYEIAEDGDPAEFVRPLLIAVVDRLRAAVRG